jgi:hypothetical protein
MSKVANNLKFGIEMEAEIVGFSVDCSEHHSGDEVFVGSTSWRAEEDGSLDADDGEYKIGDFVKETFDFATGTWNKIGTL